MPSAHGEAKGFFAGLFDLGFTSFITLKFIRVIYTVLVTLILLAALVFFLVFLFRGGAGVLVALVGVPVVTLLYLVSARVSLELIALFFRIGENTTLMASAMTVGSGPVLGGGNGGVDGSVGTGF